MTRRNNLDDGLERSAPLYPDQMLVVSLPVPPSVNHMYQNVGRGARRLTSEAVKYVKNAQDTTKMEIRRQGWKKDGEKVWNYMDLEFFFKDKRRRDSHNCIKLLTDSLEGLLYYDDYFVMPRIQNVTLDRDNPRVEIRFHAQEYDEV